MAVDEKSLAAQDPVPPLGVATAGRGPAPMSASRPEGDDNIITTSEDDGDAPKEENGLRFSKARCIALVATLTGASFLNTLSLQMVVIILPTIGKALSVPESRLQWVVSAYSLAFGCFLLVWGRVADIYGKRLIFIGGSAWVTVVTAANPFMPGEVAFDVFRGLHGLGAAANVPTAIGILGVTFPPGKAKNYAFSAYSAGAPLGSIFGNLISGLIANYASWKWVFGACAFMALAISVTSIFVIPPEPARVPPQGARSRAASIDWYGAVMITAALLALLFALTEGNVVGWATPWVPALIVVSTLVIIAFVFWQHRLESRGIKPPLIKVSMFKKTPRLGAVMLIMALFFSSFNSYLIYATYYIQDYQGYSPLQTMLRFIPTGVGGAVVAFIVARLMDKVPTLFILMTGNIAISISNLLFAVPIPPSTSYFAWTLPAMLLAVVGADTTWPSLTLFTSRALPPEDQAVGGALINAVGQLGRAIGLAISTAVQTAVVAKARGVSVEDAGGMEEGDGATLKGIRAGSWTNFALGILSLALVPLAFRSMEIVGKAAPTPRRPERSRGEEGIMNEIDINGKSKE